jgi:hypothetical protein
LVAKTVVSDRNLSGYDVPIRSNEINFVELTHHVAMVVNE